MEKVDIVISLRHSLAALAYRTARAVGGASSDFAHFEIGAVPKTPVRILAHMGDLMDWALSLVQSRQAWHDSEPLEWDREVARYFAGLGALDAALASTGVDADRANRLFQGPIADALTHTGQLAMLRRLAGCPIKGENYFVAAIEVGRVGTEQAKLLREY